MIFFLGNHERFGELWFNLKSINSSIHSFIFKVVKHVRLGWICVCVKLKRVENFQLEYDPFIKLVVDLTPWFFKRVILKLTHLPRSIWQIRSMLFGYNLPTWYFDWRMIMKHYKPILWVQYIIIMQLLSMICKNYTSKT